MNLLERTTDKVTTEGLIEGLYHRREEEGETEKKEEVEKDITREELIKHLKMLKIEKH